MPQAFNHGTEIFSRGFPEVSLPTQDILSWIFDEPRYPGDQDVYIDPYIPTNSLSRVEAKTLIRRLIAGLRSTSLKPGDCVCVHSFNNLYYSCVFLAVIGAGFVWAGTNPGYTDFELHHHLRISKTKLILVEPDLHRNIISVAEKHEIPKKNVMILVWSNYGSLNAARPGSWIELTQRGEQDWIRFNDKDLAQSTPACLLFSSGTTGLPKAALLSHHNLVAQHTLLQEQVKKPYQIKRILCLPFFHAAMVALAHITPPRSGHISYVMRRFDIEDFLHFTEKYQVTELFVVPPIIVSILQSPLVEKFSLRSLRCGMTGGAKVDLLSQKAFSMLMHPDGCLNPCYGMTEISCIGAYYPWPERDVDGSIGYFLPNLDVRLLGDDDREIRDFNVPGEICIRGPTVIKRYLDNDKANADSFIGEWFRTGDVAYCEAASRKWYIVDRKKELIKVRGFQVAPAELEGVLMSHPDVIDAAVIGIPAQNAVDGEVPQAYVVPKVGSSLDEKIVMKYIAGHLAKYKQLTGGVVFLESLPKTASGKYLKTHLRELWKKQRVSNMKL